LKFGVGKTGTLAFGTPTKKEAYGIGRNNGAAAVLTGIAVLIAGPPHPFT